MSHNEVSENLPIVISFINNNNNNEMLILIVIFRQIIIMIMSYPASCWARRCGDLGSALRVSCARLWPTPWRRSWVSWCAAPTPCPRELCERCVRQVRPRFPQSTQSSPARTNTRLSKQPCALSKLHLPLLLKLCFSGANVTWRFSFRIESKSK